MKHGQLSRLDLWEALKTNDLDSQRMIMKSLGLYYTPKEEKPNKKKETQPGTKQNNIEDKAPTKPSQLKKSPTAQLTSRYWQVVKQENKDDNEKPKKKQPIQQAIKWQNRPEKLPKYPELISLKECRSRVLPILNKQRHGRQIVDIPKLINKISHADVIKKSPKKIKINLYSHCILLMIDNAT